MEKREDRVRYGRSARDILDIYKDAPTLVLGILLKRGIEESALANIETLETALDAERRRLMHTNERRLERYSAAQRWRKAGKSRKGNCRPVPDGST